MKRIVIVIPASQQAAANRAAAIIDPVGGGRTFTSGLSLTGELPITHYVCNWAIEDDKLTELLVSLPSKGRLVSQSNSVDPRAIDKAAKRLFAGLKPVGGEA